MEWGGCGSDPGAKADVAAPGGRRRFLDLGHGGGADAVTGTPNFVVPAEGYNGEKVKIMFYHTMGANLREVLDYYIV